MVTVTLFESLSTQIEGKLGLDLPFHSHSWFNVTLFESLSTQNEGKIAILILHRAKFSSHLINIHGKVQTLFH